MYRLDYYDVSIKRLGEKYKVIYVPRIVSDRQGQRIIRMRSRETNSLVVSHALEIKY